MTILEYVKTFEGKRIYINVSSNNVVTLPKNKATDIGRVTEVRLIEGMLGFDFIEMDILYRYEPNCKEETATVPVEYDSMISLYN